jgi:hypothetical protein
MQRDWELIRVLLYKLRDGQFDDVHGYEPRLVREHLRLLVDAGLIEGPPTEGGYALSRRMRLTWQGHEFIESAQNEKVYKGVVEKASKFGAISFEIIRTMLAEVATRAMLGPG